MRRVGIILAVVLGLVLVFYGVLFWAYGDFARGVIEDARNHPMHRGNDTVVFNGDTIVLMDVQ